VRRRLADGGIRVDVRDKLGETPLMKAAENGHGVIVKTLLVEAASVNERNPFGQTALMMAKARGHWDIVELLKQAGAEE
jgi:ankyrin repeat protein